jgi:polyribonucleotide nucleotidyltransferase
VEWKTQSDPVHFVAVIGRGGEQISRIQAESGCKIQIASGKGIFFHRSQFDRNQDANILQNFPYSVPLLVARKFGCLGKYM